MVKFVWHDGEVPQGEYIKQVYGVVFTQDGRTLIHRRMENGKPFYCLAGGTVEEFDKDRIATLRREMLEEVNTTLQDDIYMVGYQEIFVDGKREPYVQIRMTAMIKEIGERKPDPDNGKMYDRFLVSPKRAIELLNWQDGDKVIMGAWKIAQEKFGLKETSQDEELV